jgi:prevent-host-death family protein
MEWQVQDAKARFSELVRMAQQEGPQVISRHGRGVVVLIDIEQFHRLGNAESKPDLSAFLTSEPRVEVDLFADFIEPERRADQWREVDLSG